MLGQSLRVGKIWGIAIGINASWFIVFVLVTLSLVAQFANRHPHWSLGYQYTIGVLTSLLFFVSVLLFSPCLIAPHADRGSQSNNSQASFLLYYMSGTPRCGFGKQRKWQAQPALP
jgi:hypothetical protein